MNILKLSEYCTNFIRIASTHAECYFYSIFVFDTFQNVKLKTFPKVITWEN